MSKLPKDYNWTYHIVGDGPELQSLKQLSSKLGLKEKVTFHGWLKKTQVNEILSQTNVYVMVSAPETLGLVYLEAMAKGNIVIGAKGWGVDGIIQNGENGFLCAPNDDYDLEKTLRYLNEVPPEVLKNLSHKTHITIHKYTREESSKNYLLTISETLRNNKRAMFE